MEPCILIIHHEQYMEVIIKTLAKRVVPNVKVVSLKDGVGAFEFLKQNPVTCIFIDHDLEGMNGMQFLIEKQSMESAIKNIPTVLLTASWQSKSLIQDAITRGHIAGLIRLPLTNASTTDQILIDLKRILVDNEGKQMTKEMSANLATYLDLCEPDKDIEVNWW